MYDAATPSASDLIPKTNLDSPSTLQSVCLDFICENLNVVCITHEQRPQTLTDRSQEDSEEASGESENPVDTPSSSQDVEMQDVADDHGDHDGPVSKSVLTEALTQLHKKLEESLHRSESARTDPKSIPVKFMKFRIPSSEDDDPFFHTELSEELLAKLCSKGLITDLVITLFDAERTRLRTVKIPDASKLSTRGLRVLKGHKIVELEVNSLSKATVTDLIGCLNEWTVANLRSLNVARSTFVDTNKHTIVVALSRLQGLANLNVARTEFNKTSLEMVVEDLPLLESLDISETKVTDISALRKAKSRLKSLSMHGLKLPSSASEATVEVLIELEELRHLDISDTKENPFDVISGGRLKVWDLLAHPEALPKLQSLDLSGKELTDLDLLETYLSHHKDLTFVGLMLSELCRADIFTTANCETTKRNKYVVTGSANENQITEAMRRYLHRPQYIQKSLYYLFRLTQGFAMARPDIIKLVIIAARQYPTVFGIQMAATACMYNLSKGELGQKHVHPHLLKEIVSTALDAMEAFPEHQQLQKNILLTVCSDRVLQDVSFDRYRCARLVMDCLCAWQDNAMNKMSVAVVSILAARITTAQTSQLGSNRPYMQRLLSMVKSRLGMENHIDVTLKFTLSALWNLTDESPSTCQVFLDEGGMELFLAVLEKYPDEMCVETKVLGLLNNIAEVSSIRSRLMDDHFLHLLKKLMHSSDIEVSYFAAGIAAHLSSDREVVWSTVVTKEELTDELAKVVMSWREKEKEMVAYRSFKPFFPLMEIGQHYAVQLWAVWAIHHVCSNNEKRYCPMLASQGGHEILSRLYESYSTNAEVKSLIGNILESLRRNHCNAAKKST